MKRITSIITMLFLAVYPVYGQGTTDFYKEIAGYDLSKVIQPDSITGGDNNNAKFAYPEPLGYIGDSFQRFQIHYSAIKKSRKDAHTYIVNGKTKFEGRIRKFAGTIQIDSAGLFQESEDSAYKQGYAVATLVFYEDSTKPKTGIIKGIILIGWKMNGKGIISYDDLEMVADGFCNNEVTATWTAYKTGKHRKCNWGDFRIPDSKGLDVGAGIFIVEEHHIKYGWQEWKKEQDEQVDTSKEKEWWR